MLCHLVRRGRSATTPTVAIIINDLDPRWISTPLVAMANKFLYSYLTPFYRELLSWHMAMDLCSALADRGYFTHCVLLLWLLFLSSGLPKSRCHESSHHRTWHVKHLELHWLPNFMLSLWMPWILLPKCYKLSSHPPHLQLFTAKHSVLLGILGVPS